MKQDKGTAKQASTWAGEVMAIAQEVRGLLTANDATLTKRFAAAQHDRAEALEADRCRLESALGADHPRVAALGAKVSRVQAMSTDLRDAIEDQACVDGIGDREWAVVGKVLDRSGMPLAGLRVQLAAEDGEPVTVLKPLKTDARGRFRVVYHSADLAAKDGTLPAPRPRDNRQEAPPKKASAVQDDSARSMFEDERAFRVLIQNVAGKPVFKSPETITPREGSFTSLTISLPASAVPTADAKQQCAAATAKGTQCRNVAIAGSTYCARHS